jgi:hypothetical protein
MREAVTLTRNLLSVLPVVNGESPDNRFERAQCSILMK